MFMSSNQNLIPSATSLRTGVAPTNNTRSTQAEALGQFATLIAQMMTSQITTGSSDSTDSMSSNMLSDSDTSSNGAMSGVTSDSMMNTLMMLLASELESSNTGSLSPTSENTLTALTNELLPNNGLSSSQSLGEIPSNMTGGETSTDATEIQSAIQNASTTYGVPANLIRAVIQQESGMDPQSVSSSGAMGLMQLMPSTAAGLGVTNPYNPVQNINGGTQYLSNLLHHFNGNTELALAAYNAGPNAVETHHGIPPYPETTAYVKQVMAYAKQFEPTYG
jgi:soluble lytic murein transglycosylase-like protein